LSEANVQLVMTDDAVDDATALSGSQHNTRMSGSRRPGLAFSHV